jgi:hypothetical protein
MSAKNGDKSRFHRERKQKIARRQRIRELMNVAAAPPKPAPRPRNAKTESLSA